MENKEKEINKFVSEDKLNEAIDVALSAPFPRLAIHHLIDRILEFYTYTGKK